MVSFIPPSLSNASNGFSLPQPSTGDQLAERNQARADQVLLKAYERLQSKLALPGTQPLPSERQSAERTAGNILGFIDAQLAKDQASGASTDQLNSRLDAGLKGFQEGFNEARTQLREMGLLSPEIDQEIGETYDRVIQGFDQLRNEYVSQGAGSLSQNNTSQASFNGSLNAAKENTFEFQLRTLDGDVVNISANSLSAVSSAVRADSKGANNVSAVSLTSYQSSEFSLSVTGELDDEELEVIGRLLEKVSDLSGDFYSGNLQEAFEKAANLGLDDSEIASYSLNLTQVQVQQAQVAYQSNTPDNTADLLSLLKPVGEFAQSLLDALDEAAQFQEPKQLLSDIGRSLGDLTVNSFESDIPPESNFGAFVERLLNVL